MIQFFRRIRQKLLTEGKTRRYLKYALGEIFLVVLGILIALQINNWNNANLQHQKEIVLLTELKKSLEGDLKGEFIPAEGIYRRLLEGHDKINSFYNNEATFTNDSLTEYFRLCFRPEWDFVFNTAAFENIKSTGIDIISNNALRSEISSLYSYSYPNIKEVNQNYIRYHDLQLSPIVYDTINLSEGTFSPRELDFLKQSIPISNRLRKIRRQRTFLYTFLLRPVKTKVETAIHDIELELQRLQK